MDNIDKVWEQYAKTKDKNIKQKLILEYATLVKFVAGRLSVHIGQHVDYDDLVSYGIFGLIDAIDKFDYEKGVKFETYASLRIRGAIIDSIRKLDWVPRTLRQKNKQLEQTYQELEFELGREPTEEELADKLNISIDEVKELIKKSSVVSLISLDDYLEQNHEADYSAGNNNRKDSPEAIYEMQEVKELLKDAIDKLSEKERKVISLYYFEDLTLKEISKIMDVSESRISQIHSKAVLRLQTRLGKYKNILFAN
ncbi:MAG: FliA/WhiG family RNA polymerase sigma factor [Clostridiales bacterium]|jgi:RNA polymerase sigma factor for flagellar operon FliA|nr:FliA/WhiG family RNA polymerase sigma factor [Clostridiales bacterium]